MDETIDLCSEGEESEYSERKERSKKKVSKKRTRQNDVEQVGSGSSRSEGLNDSQSMNRFDPTHGIGQAMSQLRQIQQEHEGVQFQIQQTEAELNQLQDRLGSLIAQRGELESMMESLKNQAAGRQSGIEWSSENFSHSAQAREALRRWFGFDRFRSLQLCAINATLSGVDTFVLMPTGSGKSLIFQLPAVMEQNKLTVVISPLLSLSRDQVIGLHKKGISATMLSSETPKDQRKDVMNAIKSCSIRLLYITPEKIVKSKMLLGVLEKLNDQGKLGRFVIDEAHCCSTMGHDFRADYSKLFIIKNRFPDRPVLAVTATATIRVQKQIREVLLGKSSTDTSWQVFRATFNRVNLFYEVVEKKGTEKEHISEIAEMILKRFKNQCGIMYCFSRKDCDESAAALCREGVHAASYHADLPPSEKERVHALWNAWNSKAAAPSGVQIICATSAFGMGIDKPDVRFVFHRTLPKSMEAYCQESGRAGRDGNMSHCIIFYRRSEILKVSSLVSQQMTGLEKLVDMINFCESVDECRRACMARVFGEPFDKGTQCAGNCDNCTKAGELETLYDRVDATDEAKDLLSELSKIVKNKGSSGRITMNQLISQWRTSHKTWSVSLCEHLCAKLLGMGVFSITWADTAYATNAYLKPGSGSSLLNLGRLKVLLFVLKSASKRKAAASSTKTPKSSTSKYHSSSSTGESAVVKRRERISVHDSQSDEEIDLFPEESTLQNDSLDSSAVRLNRLRTPDKSPEKATSSGDYVEDNDLDDSPASNSNVVKPNFDLMQSSSGEEDEEGEQEHELEMDAVRPGFELDLPSGSESEEDSSGAKPTSPTPGETNPLSQSSDVSVAFQGVQSLPSSSLRNPKPLRSPGTSSKARNKLKSSVLDSESSASDCSNYESEEDSDEDFLPSSASKKKTRR